MKNAVCIGINNYPGNSNDLNGCVNDANDWSDALKSFGFQTSVILDGMATRANILKALENLVADSSAGDVIVMTYSGHGTSVADTSGDEPDSYDEALYVYDGVLLDDELREVLQNIKPNVHAVFVADSCFSGTVTRALISEAAVPRYVKTGDIQPDARRKKAFLSEQQMLEVLLTGCTDAEYSYDAYINDRWNGALSANALAVLKKGQTYSEFYAALRQRLPSPEYPQTPQLEGSSANKARIVFDSITTPVPEPNPDPTPDPTPTPPTGSWLAKYWWVIALVAAAAFIVWRLL